MSSVGLGRAGRRLPTLPALDGIRAVAIAAVLLYHSDIFWFPGGLLGVEVFFVLSGYLITSLLLGDLQSVDRMRIGEFLTRRARRLLPALFVMLAAVSTIFVVFLPGDVARIRGDVAAAATYTSNWYLVGSDHSYFISFARPSPFGHLWSLAIEEQFYLIWPLLVLAALRFRGVRAVAWIAGAGIVLSLMARLVVWDSGAGAVRVYYGTDTRVDGLLVGCLVATLLHLNVVRRVPAGLAAVAAVGILVLAGPGTPMSANVLASTLVPWLTAGVIAAAATGTTWEWLERRRLRLVGKRSYALYLWHHPLAVAVAPLLPGPFAFNAILMVGVAWLLASLSWRYVEAPALAWRPREVSIAVRTGLSETA